MSYYGEKFEQGAEYMDFITDALLNQYNFSLNAYTSRSYQFNRGESASGIEVKNDARMAETGNVYIEVAEKSVADMPDFTPSGIYRDDGSWLYLIGDYQRALLMSKRQLRICIEYGPSWREKQGIRGPLEIGMGTSRGYLFPVEYCKRFLCLRFFVFKERR